MEKVEITEQLERLAAQNDSLNDECESLKIELASAEQTSAELGEFKTRLETGLDKATEELSQLQSVLSTGQNELQKKEAKLQEALADLGAANDSIAERDRQLVKAASETDVNEALQQRLSQLEQEKTAAESATKTAQDVATELQARIDESETQLVGNQANIQQLSEKLELAEVEQAELLDSVQSLTNQLDQLRMDKDEQRRGQEQDSSELAEQREKIEALETALASSMTEQETARKENATIKGELAELNSTQEQLASERQKYQLDQQNALDELEQLRALVAEQDKKIAWQLQLENQLRDEAVELIQERDQLAREREGLTVTQTDQIGDADVVEQLQLVIEERDQYRLKRRELRKKYKFLYEKFETAKERLQSRKQQVALAQHHLKQAIEENAKLSSRLKEMDVRNPDEVALLQNEIERLREILQVSEDRFKEFGVRYRKDRLKFKQYKTRVMEYKALIEAYHRVTKLTPAMVSQKDSLPQPPKAQSAMLN